MLYISRYINGDLYGVVDSDDGTEQVVNLMELSRISRLGLIIEGLYAGESRIDYCAEPYQVPDKMTLLQTKTFALTGVDVVVYEDMVASIKCNKMLSDTVIRLSDFGGSMADMLFKANRVPMSHSLTVVFDDKLAHAGELSLVPIFNSEDVKLDFREVRHPTLISSLYKSVLTNCIRRGYMSWQAAEGCIIDNPRRKRLLLRHKYSYFDE